MRLKSISLLLFSCVVITNWSCSSKAIEQKKEDLLVTLITANIWIMESFSEGSTNLTADFSGYEFKFYTDLTVQGIRTGFPTATGTWAGNASDMTVQANFPTETGVLKKLNGTFTVTSSTLSDVNAHRFEGAVELKLHLVKK